MHVAIDLGSEYTCLCCWEPESDLDNPCISVKIPGLGAFDADENYRTWSDLTVTGHLAHLQREYLLPSRKPVGSAAVSVPALWPLSARAGLLRAIEEILSLDDVIIIPQPLALTGGFNLHHPRNSLAGDVLVIQSLPSGSDFALLSLTDNGGLILEKHFSGDQARLEMEMTANGYLGPDGWVLDQVLLTGAEDLSGWQEYLLAHAKDPDILTVSDSDFTAAEGLFMARDGAALSRFSRFSAIYPFEFCLVIQDRLSGAPEAQWIPFDTANLELDCQGTYAILNLDLHKVGINMAPDARLHLQVYEVPSQILRDSTCLPAPHHLVAELDNPLNNLPPHLIFHLDMLHADLFLELDGSKPRVAASASRSLALGVASSHDHLLDLLNSQSLYPDLVKEWESHLHNPPAFQTNLSNLLHNSLFRLYALSRLWSE